MHFNPIDREDRSGGHTAQVTVANDENQRTEANKVPVFVGYVLHRPANRINTGRFNAVSCC